MIGVEFTILNAFIDFMFLLDIIINFRTTFYDLESGDEEFDPYKIAIVYLKGRFTIDLLSTVPFDVIASAFTDSDSPLFKLSSQKSSFLIQKFV